MTGTLTWPDYVVWANYLILILSIGIYFAFVERKRKKKSHGIGSTKEFLLAGKHMNPLPVSGSIIASFFSAITLLGTPNEIYQHGVMYWFISIAYVLNIFAAIIFFVPVFYEIKLNSSYEYLGFRFSKLNHILGAASFICQTTPYLGIVLYSPCLALSTVMNMNIWLIVIIMAVICTIYTTVGGLRAVIWNAVLQLIMMFVSMGIVIGNGVSIVGGYNNVWKAAYERDRMDLSFSFDIQVRHSFWSVTIGGFFLWLSIYGINQTMIQRAISIKTLRQAQLAYLLNIPGINLLLMVVVLAGFVLFAVYKDCDIIRTKVITKSDQLVPYFVSQYIVQYPGVAGIFVAGIFSGGFSAMSSGLNSLAAVTLHDVIMLKFQTLTDARATLISKGLVIFYGILTVIFALISSLTDKVLQMSIGLFGMVSGPLLGVFTLGIFFPFGNYYGATAGHLVSQFIVCWIGFGCYAANVKYPQLELRNNNCSGKGMFSFPASELTANGLPITGINNLYAISYMWYCAIGWFLSLVVGLVVSAITGRGKYRKLPSQYITPLLRNVYSDYLFEPVEQEIQETELKEFTIMI